jgi:hypothetical protein
MLLSHYLPTRISINLDCNWRRIRTDLLLLVSEVVCAVPLQAPTDIFPACIRECWAILGMFATSLILVLCGYGFVGVGI